MSGQMRAQMLTRSRLILRMNCPASILSQKGMDMQLPYSDGNTGLLTPVFSLSATMGAMVLPIMETKTTLMLQR